MDGERIERAIGRIEAAMERIAATRASLPIGAEPSSARVASLVNAHEKLREQVAESLRDLDDLLERLED